jgi:hypothetical protein
VTVVTVLKQPVAMEVALMAVSRRELLTRSATAAGVLAVGNATSLLSARTAFAGSGSPEIKGFTLSRWSG